MEGFFVYDRLIGAHDICNFKTDISNLSKAVEKGLCVRLYGRRNFGKTSIVKNVIAPAWEALNSTNRVSVYVDLYAVQSLQDISQEFTKAFSRAITKKSGLLEKSLSWLRTLKHVRPTWQPPTETNGFGEFSIKAELGADVVDFEIILDNMNRLSRTGKFSFLLILDEFQEISNIRQAEAKLRAGLQELGPENPVVILGSKQHMLDKIFNKPKAPFHAWGTTIELRNIPYEEYFLYMQRRFERAGKTIELAASTYLQDLMGRIPESINRLCDAIADRSDFIEITTSKVDEVLNDFLESAMSVYSSHYAEFSASERKVLHGLAGSDRVSRVLSSEFVGRTGGVSKSGVEQIVKRFLDRGVIYQEHTQAGASEYLVADPLFKFYLRKYKSFH